jgi:hypothetical protein
MWVAPLPTHARQISKSSPKLGRYASPFLFNSLFKNSLLLFSEDIGCII